MKTRPLSISSISGFVQDWREWRRWYPPPPAQLLTESVRNQSQLNMDLTIDFVRNTNTSHEELLTTLEITAWRTFHRLMERGVYVHYLLPRFLAEVLPNLVEYEFQEELRSFLEEVTVVMKLRWKAREIEIPNFIQSKITQFLKNKQEKIKDNKVMKIDRKLKLRVMDLVFK